jgi:chromosome segregation ATPase
VVNRPKRPSEPKRCRYEPSIPAVRALDGPLRNAYQLADALGELSNTVGGLKTDQLNQSLTTLAQTFAETPDNVKIAVDGVARISQTLNERDSQLRDLLANANKATTVLAERSEKIVGLVHNTNALLVELQSQSAAMDQISGNISALSQQLQEFIEDNRQLEASAYKPTACHDNRVEPGEHHSSTRSDVTGRVASWARFRPIRQSPSGAIH